MLCQFSFRKPLKVQFCFSILHFKIALKKYERFFLSLRKICYAVNKEKVFFIFLQKTYYSKHIKTEKNPQVVKHVVKPDFYGDGYLPLQGRASKRRRNFALIFSHYIRTFLACKERSDGIASLSSVSHGNLRFPRNSSTKQKNNGQSIDYPLFLR